MAKNLQQIRLMSRTVSVFCCLLFAVFSFVYMYLFQGDMMQMVQHLLSNGRTTYKVLLFSSLITCILTCVGFLCTHFMRLPLRFKALAWFPSYWILGWLTDVSLVEIADISQQPHRVGFPAFIISGIVYLAVVFVVMRLNDPDEDKASMSAYMWPNLLILVGGMTFTTIAGNTKRVLHYELRMERLAINGDFAKILERQDDVNMETSHCIAYLRAYALSQKGELGNQLFLYPNNYGSNSLLPSNVDSLRPANMPAKLRKYFGGFPIHDMNATHFFQYLASDTVVSEPVKDYLLCSFLLDKNLSEFVDSLVVYYGPKDTVNVDETIENKAKKNKKEEKEPIHLQTLPRHYAEALLLYSRLTEKPVAVLDNDEILQNYLDFSVYNKESMDIKLRESQCRKYYNGTYWCYYFFNKQCKTR